MGHGIYLAGVFTTLISPIINHLVPQDSKILVRVSKEKSGRMSELNLIEMIPLYHTQDSCIPSFLQERDVENFLPPGGGKIFQISKSTSTHLYLFPLGSLERKDLI